MHRAAALATEDPTPDLLTKKPHGRDEPLISKYMWRFILTAGIYQVRKHHLARWWRGEAWSRLQPTPAHPYTAFCLTTLPLPPACPAVLLAVPHLLRHARPAGPIQAGELCGVTGCTWRGRGRPHPGCRLSILESKHRGSQCYAAHCLAFQTCNSCAFP